MADVAARAGVSLGTVSRALRGLDGVSPGTRDRIREVAAELDYVVNPEAAALAGRSTGRVAVVLHDLPSWYGSSVVLGLERVLRPAGLDLLVRCVDDPEDRVRFFASMPLRRKVDAVVVVAIALTSAEVAKLHDGGVAVVAAGSHSPDVPFVAIDDVLAAQQAVNHLLQLGHRRIALLNTVAATDRAWQAQRDREQGFRLAMEMAGIPVDEELVVSWSGGSRGGAQGMDRLLSGRRLPSAVFAFSDEVALGAMRSLRRAGIGVPRQISVLSIDDHPLAELTDLTTVAQDPVALGRAAAEQVLDLLHGRPVREVGPFPTRLVVRGTTAPPLE
ncbi:LacI family DNA-binding transcriptional regulator [Kineococcus aurantiacus]|uniref:DNA-binding LacI/PurR family transcriptional regulator n=1 Tax=Kineococcus aurantiacus TaxID=37633 RepID=A0A7Y9DLA1_9ACTN|nr:LacI family DNA-binding transcriptional regulator [Kineococcus aurantiacus]NYD22707.1 DNA-binding LacI/PurR family transcriptional regulator [Kineococcus aurantiacus]